MFTLDELYLIRNFVRISGDLGSSIKVGKMKKKILVTELHDKIEGEIFEKVNGILI